MDKLDQLPLGQLLPYVPKLLQFLSTAPAILAGWLIGMIIFFCAGSSFAPEIGGFHVVAIAILRVLWPMFQTGKNAAKALRIRKEAVKSFSKDIQLVSHAPKLDLRKLCATKKMLVHEKGNFCM